MSVDKPPQDENAPTDNPAECSEGTPLNHGWFKASRGPEPLELIASNPLCYVLAAVIAHRARWSDKFNRHGLEMGEALLGDFAQYGMSERQYRTCKENLQKWGFATFRTTNRGTIGKLCDSRLFAVSKFVTDGQNDSRSDRRPTDDRRTTDDKHRALKKLRITHIFSIYSSVRCQGYALAFGAKGFP